MYRERIRVAPQRSGFRAVRPIPWTPSGRLTPTVAVPAFSGAIIPQVDVYEELVRLRNLGQKCALATIVDVRGSIPSYESAKLLVREDGSMIGTIGGGCVEAEVWNAARDVLDTEKPKHLSFNLGQDAAYDNGLICGGQLDVFVEPVLPLPRAFIFGAGHISKSLSKVANLAGFGTVVVDNRESFANRERFPEAFEIHAEEYEEVFPKLVINETSYIIIVTRGHRDDMRVLKLALATPARYLAMIGSKRKVINVIRELRKEGIPQEAFERIHAPMGLDIGAISPEEIAISVAAEMIAVRRKAQSDWRALSLSVFADESLRAVLAK
jgi:xanthine dehydrogenase accessory factor